MTRRSIFNGILAAAAVTVLAIGGFAQGKHDGKKHGGDHGHRGGGKHEKQWNGGGKQEKHWNGNRGNDDDRGKGKAWGRQQTYAGPREYQQQVRQQQRHNDWAFWQQRQNEKSARKQQKEFDRDIRRQQADIARQQRYQQRIYRQQYDDRPRLRHDNGLHLGWYKNGKAYDNGVPWARDRAFERDWRKAEKRGRRMNDIQYVYDPIVTYLPAYQEPYYADTPREYFVRSLISSFFGQQPVEYYYQPYEVYEVSRPAYVYQEPYRYSNAVYSPVYYDQDYGDPYYSGYDEFGGGSLKSSLLNLGLELLQGFLGTGYSQGLYDGAYARNAYGPRYVNTYFDPYAAEPAYYSPYVSSLADERQLFEEGYRLGYQDAMRDRDAYANFNGLNTGDLVTEFLAATLIDRL